MDMEHWADYRKRNAVTPEKAMELLDGWYEDETAIGMLFIAGAEAAVTMRTKVQRILAGRLDLRDPKDPAGASFGLSRAGFQYGPVMLFPRWPSPPPVNVQGLSVWLPSGGWLFLWDAGPGTTGAGLIGPRLLGPTRVG
jgi:hypothetical protein